MLTRIVPMFAFAVSLALFGSSYAPAQGPGKGGSTRQLEAELDKLRDQIKALEGKLSKAKDSSKDEKGGPPSFGKGPGGFGKGPGGFDPEKMKKAMEGFGKGPGGFGKGPGGFAKGPGGFDPEKMKKVMEIYEKLYGKAKSEGDKGGEAKKGSDKGGPPYGRGKGGFDRKTEAGKGGPPPFGGKGRGGFGGPPGRHRSIDSRIEHLIAELEQLRKDLKKK